MSRFLLFALATTNTILSAAAITGSCNFDFVLWNADSASPKNSLQDADVLAIEDYKFNIEAVPDRDCAGVESMKLEIVGPDGFDSTRTENVVPYMAFGDRSCSLRCPNDYNTNPNGKKLRTGSYLLTVTAYSKDGASGEMLGTSTISFSASDDNPESVPTLSPTPAPSPSPSIAPPSVVPSSVPCGVSSMSWDVVTLELVGLPAMLIGAEYQTFLDVTETFLYANIGFPSNSFKFFGVDGVSDPSESASPSPSPFGSKIQFFVYVTLGCGDSSPILSTFFVDVLSSPAYVQELKDNVLSANVADQISEVRVVDPVPFVNGFGRV